MKKEIKHEIKTYEVERTELYCDKCGKRINHYDKFWHIHFDIISADVCSNECAKPYFNRYLNDNNIFFNNDFMCGPQYWNEFTGKGD